MRHLTGLLDTQVHHFNCIISLGAYVRFTVYVHTHNTCTYTHTLYTYLEELLQDVETETKVRHAGFEHLPHTIVFHQLHKHTEGLLLWHLCGERREGKRRNQVNSVWLWFYRMYTVHEAVHVLMSKLYCIYHVHYKRNVRVISSPSSKLCSSTMHVHCYYLVLVVQWGTCICVRSRLYIVYCWNKQYSFVMLCTLFTNCTLKLYLHE